MKFVELVEQMKSSKMKEAWVKGRVIDIETFARTKWFSRVSIYLSSGSTIRYHGEVFSASLTLKGDWSGVFENMDEAVQYIKANPFFEGATVTSDGSAIRISEEN